MELDGGAEIKEKMDAREDERDLGQAVPPGNLGHRRFFVQGVGARRDEGARGG